MNKIKRIGRLCLLVIVTVAPTYSWARAPSSSAADPGQASTHIQEALKKQPKRAQERVRYDENLTKEDPTQEPAEEKKLFILKGVDIKGSNRFSQEELLTTYRFFLDKPVGFKDIKTIKENIVEHYRSNQYFFVKVLLPQQKIDDGILRLQVLESKMAAINVEGDPGKAKRFFKKYEHDLSQEPTFNYKSIQKIVYLANKLPGVKAQAVLAASEEVPNGAELNMFIKRKRHQTFMHFNTRNGNLLGPAQAIVGHTRFNPFFGGDELSGIYAFNPNDPYRMRYAAGSFKQVFADGSHLSITGSVSRTQPASLLSVLGFEGRSNSITLKAGRPLLSSFRTHWELYSQFDLTHVETLINALNAKDSDNQLRTLRFGSHIERNDRFGQHNLDIRLSQGLEIFGAFKRISETSGLERPGELTFTSLSGEYTRLQYLSKPITLQVGVKGQISTSALITSEKFFFGGRNFGRGYDNSEFTGDSGVATYVEFRLDRTPNIPHIKRVQFYGFYDIGVLFNREIEDLRRTSGASTGFGIRFFSDKIQEKLRWYASTELTFPLTRTPVAEPDRTPRLFFFFNAYL